MAPRSASVRALKVSAAASRHRLLSDPTRLLIVVSLAEGPSTVQRLAEGAGVHPNTVRAHLDRLGEAGFVVSEREGPAGRGRPRILYRLSPDADAGDLAGRDYRMLAEVLIGIVRSQAGHDVKRVAVRSGEAWGRHLSSADAPRPGREPAPPEVAAYVVRLMDRLKFAPAVRKGKAGWTVLLHNCPYRELARENEDLICSFHLGLVRGVLKVLGAPMAADLEPHVEPDLCRVRLLLGTNGGPAGEGKRKP